ncbi:polynucleotide phosphorylase [Lutibacter sp. B2]|nr:polynucleotide phosphorylase [Lutibacter sp. B2]
MQKEYLSALQPLNYASLTQEQSDQLREVEKKFSADTNKDVYFMVMEK